MPKHAADEGVFAVAAAAAVVDAAAAADEDDAEDGVAVAVVDVDVVGIFGIDLLCVTMRNYALA